jgi:transcriptional regulator with XRE-family HTH domain
MRSQLDSSPTEPPSGSLSVRLTRERIRQLAESLIAGCTRKEAAKALGVSPRTVTRWKKDPAVLAEIERLLNRGPETRALERLERLLDSDDDKVALGAAQTLVRREMQRLAITFSRR